MQATSQATPTQTGPSEGELTLLDSLEGMLSIEEVRLLWHLAAEVREGAILEVGSYRGRSTAALALGARAGHGAPVFAIEPHEVFTGAMGGQFSGQDRTAFFKAMLRAECADSVRLINLSSEVVAPGWSRPLGLLWIDGDHTFEGALRDADCWIPHLMPGCMVAFHDSLDTNLGPHRVIAGLLARGDFESMGSLGVTTVLRKLA